MAKKIVLKRWDGSSYEEILPKTTTDQVVGLATALNEKLDADMRGAADGVASLDSESKVPVSQLPSDVITGMSFQGTYGQGSQFPQTPQPGYDGENVGKFWIITDSLSLQLASGEKFKASDGTLYDNQETIDFQSGDWLIVIEQDEGEAPFWSIVDNNQADRYLSKAGGTLSGNLNMGGNDIQNVGDVRPDAVVFSSGATSRRLEVDTGPDSSIRLRFGSNTVWHSGNDGEGSGLDADQLDGQHGDFYRNASNINAGEIDDEYLPNEISSDTTGNAATADKWSSPMSFRLTGDVSMASPVSFDGSTDMTNIQVSIDDDGHTHTHATITSRVSQSMGDYFDDPNDDTPINDRFTQVGRALRKKNRTYIGTSTPASGDNNAIENGDLWFDTNNELD